MGHSFGGTFAQLLVGNGLGSAGVSIDGAAVKGINAMPCRRSAQCCPRWTTRPTSTGPRSSPPSSSTTRSPTRRTRRSSKAAYDRYSAPTPAKVLFQGGFAAVTPHAATTFDFADDDRAPLLFISGGSDHILPPVVQRHNYEKNAKHSTAIAAHKLFPGRDHFTCGEPGWEAVADFALDWALAPVAGELN